MTTVIKEPELVPEILVYQSGNHKYTTNMNNMIGIPNITAIGKPPNNLAANLLCCTRSVSQYLMKACSFSVSMLQN